MRPARSAFFLAFVVLVAVACASTARPGKPPAECAGLGVPIPEGVKLGRVLSRKQARPPFDGTRAGYVCVHATIDVEGRLVDAEIVKTNHQVFAQEFVESLAGWRYEPSTRDGVPVEVRTFLSASFLRSPG
jgi:hypothetical protein